MYKKVLIIKSPKYYQDSVEELRKVFYRLNLIVDGIPCIRFADPEVKRICVSLWDTDGNGDINVSEAEAPRTLFVGTFANNALIKTFDEFKHFNIVILYNGNFTNCSSLKSISLPKSYTTIRYQDFKGTALEHIELPDTLTQIGGQAFMDVLTLKDISIPDSVVIIDGNAFTGTGISKFVYPAGDTVIDGLGRNPNLTYVEIGVNAVSVTGMGECPVLKTLIIKAITPPTTNYWTLLNAPQIPFIYVPDGSVETYKTASGWNKWAAYFRPLSEYKG